HWLAHRRRHGIHVRSQHTFIHSPAQLVSRGRSSAIAVGHLAPGLRPPGMALPDADRLGGGSRQLFLAYAVRRELGPGPLPPRVVYFPTHPLLRWCARRGGFVLAGGRRKCDSPTILNNDAPHLWRSSAQL